MWSTVSFRYLEHTGGDCEEKWRPARLQGAPNIIKQESLGHEYPNEALFSIQLPHVPLNDKCSSLKCVGWWMVWALLSCQQRAPLLLFWCRPCRGDGWTFHHCCPRWLARQPSYPTTPWLSMPLPVYCCGRWRYCNCSMATSAHIHSSEDKAWNTDNVWKYFLSLSG